MTVDPDDYEQSINILNRLRSGQKEFIRKVIDGLPEKAAFVEAYRSWVGDWNDTHTPLFILVEEDAQIMAKDMIGRELTEDELHDVSLGVQAGLDEWGEIMGFAIRGVTGESE